MRVETEGLAAVTTPVFGPAVITVLGLDIPILALMLSVMGLLLSRMIAPPSLRKLNPTQEIALTMLLVIILFLIVTGTKPLGNGNPIGAGMGVVWGIGLGFSGMLIIEFFGEWTLGIIKAMLGRRNKSDD